MLIDTYDGTPVGVSSILAATEPIDGYCSAGVGLLPVVIQMVPTSWAGTLWAMERISVQWCMTWAVLGRCSLILRPLTLVSIGLNSPRIVSGAAGARTHMSMLAGPPASQTRMTLLALAVGLP